MHNALSSLPALATSTHTVPAVAPEPIASTLLIALGLVILNGLFVAFEFALVKVRESQLDELAASGNRRALLARHMLRHMDSYLSASQLGITISSLALGWLGAPLLATAIQPVLPAPAVTSPAALSAAALACAFALIIFLHVVLGEMIPKTLATRKPVATTLLLTRPLAVFHFLLKPVVWTLEATANILLRHVFRLNPADDSELTHSEQEIRQIVSETGSTEEVSPIGREILINALDLGRRVARDIMTPRGQIVYLDALEGFENNLTEAIESRHTRFPVCRGNLDETTGLIHIKDLLAAMHEGRRDLDTITRDLMSVPERMPIEKLLTLFLGKHAHLAAVVDEYGGTVGIVTLDNVLEELVGEIHDEFDMDNPEFIRLNTNEFVVAGTLGLHELEEFSDLQVESSHVSTVAGYIVHLLGHLPETGESIKVENYLATVTKTDGKSVGQIHFKRLPAETGPDTADEGAPADSNHATKPDG